MTDKCIACGRKFETWAEQKRQFGRALRRGFSADEVKPRCQKCTTIWLKAVPAEPEPKPEPEPF